MSLSIFEKLEFSQSGGKNLSLKLKFMFNTICFGYSLEHFRTMKQHISQDLAVDIVGDDVSHHDIVREKVDAVGREVGAYIYLSWAFVTRGDCSLSK